jgi:hypothetical protein
MVGEDLPLAVGVAGEVGGVQDEVSVLCRGELVCRVEEARVGVENGGGDDLVSYQVLGAIAVGEECIQDRAALAECGFQEGELWCGDGEGEGVDIPEPFEALAVAECVIVHAVVPHHAACGFTAMG